MVAAACVSCDAPLPSPSSKGGRPRRFCSDSCKNRWRYEVRLERENPPQRDEERLYAWDVEFYRREGADRRAARRRRRQEEARAEKTRRLGNTALARIPTGKNDHGGC